MIRCNNASFWRAVALGALLASTVTLFACGASHNMPVSTMPGGTMPGQSPHPMSHPRPHP